MNKSTLTLNVAGLYHQYADPRVEDWLLMDRPMTVISIVVAYLLIIHIGPKHMTNRKPYNISKFLMFYNFSLVLLTCYCFYEIIRGVQHVKFHKGCMTVDYSNTPEGIRMAGASWWYFFSKVIELLDTVFFVARKKQNQVTFLHVYHHSTMVVVCWFVTKFIPGGMKFFPALMNCFIHVLMYSYYGLAALGPHMQKYLWWKKYLTRLQIVQFILATSYLLYAFIMPCGYPRFISAFGIIYSLTFLSLFINFYYQAYIKSQKRVCNNNNNNEKVHLKKD